MYGKKRIVLQARNTYATSWVVIAGGGSSHPIGVWYKQDGLYYADLKTPEQSFQLVRASELGDKAFGGGFGSKVALRAAIARRHGLAA